MFLADLHIHSTFSDGKLSIPEVVDLYGSRGFGAIAITDHLCEDQTAIGRASRYLGYTLTAATFPLYIEILKSEAERAWRQYGMAVIPGVEFTKNSIRNHRSAHVLGIGITQFLPADLPVKALCGKVREMGGISVAAHPVWTRKMEKQTYFLWDNREDLSGAFDAWEVASGPHLFPEVASARLPKVASGDLHRPPQISSWKTVFRCERRAEAILEAVRKQEVEFRFYREENALAGPLHPSTPVLARRARSYALGHAL